MSALIWRELIVICRTGPLWTAAALYVAVLFVFILVWGDGMPIAGTGGAWEQFAFVQRGVLLVILPWVAARCPRVRGPQLTLLALATGSVPSRLAIARCVAVTAVLSIFWLLALPHVVLMRHIAALPLSAVGASLLPLLGPTMFIASVAVAATSMCRDVFRAWLVTAGAALIAGTLIPVTAAAMGIWIGLATVVCVWLVRVVENRETYLLTEAA